MADAERIDGGPRSAVAVAARRGSPSHVLAWAVPDRGGYVQSAYVAGVHDKVVDQFLAEQAMSTETAALAVEDHEPTTDPRSRRPPEPGLADTPPSGRRSHPPRPALTALLPPPLQ